MAQILRFARTSTTMPKSIHSILGWFSHTGSRGIASSAASASSSAASSAGHQVAFVAEHVNLASPEKKRGEDALFVHSHAAGLADGVGGWAEAGVDPGKYSRALMQHCLEYTKTAALPADPLKVMEYGFNHAKSVKGSSTATVMTAGLGQVLAQNLGDSGILCLRPQAAGCPTDASGARTLRAVERQNSSTSWVVVHKSTEGQHYFNCPLQLGSGSTDRPKHGESLVMPVHHGDILILASDGLFDNIFTENIELAASAFNYKPCAHYARQLERIAEPGKYTKDIQKDELTVEALDNAEGQCRGSLQQLAVVLAQQAQRMGANEKIVSPFAVNAARHGHRFAGGKLDDVSVIVAMVTPHVPAKSGKPEWPKQCAFVTTEPAASADNKERA